MEIERTFTVTIDNASANNVVISVVSRSVNGWKGSVLDGEFMHLRRCAHIINLIVSEELKDLNQLISTIRNAVRYVRSSPVRVKDKACVEEEKIDYKGLLVLDVPTRWNSTYMMLDVAIKFQKAFEKY
ncbi:LOW QUALITY PROTEIN: Ribonuclease H-like domain containing protein [Trema orientale]|uniref:Ribonuclease H-like domain containing protein n=1 Tax=Trema orientale TaxID=63057 RepID=A0A2P5CC36_TREOI|nr:LOW QUALITY PROTEIN: Ribonuclease H-like domain containing protein [Trema orientale]